MPKRLVTVNALLVVVAASLVAYIGWELTRPAPRRAPAPSRPTAAVTQPATSAPAEVPVPPGGYGMIASRNLFSPTRTDTPATAGGPGTVATNVPRPNLYGVVLRDGAPIAYLEDPVTKRVAGYRVGDAVAGGTLKSIDADRVVLTRPEGTVDVRLHDPAKPRPAAPQQPAAQPAAGAPVPAAAPPLPGVIPPAQQPPAPAPGQVGVQQPPGLMPGRRPLPPNLLRRFQQNAPGNEPAR